MGDARGCVCGSDVTDGNGCFIIFSVFSKGDKGREGIVKKSKT